MIGVTVAALASAVARATPPGSAGRLRQATEAGPVRMTIELAWNSSELPTLPEGAGVPGLDDGSETSVDMELSEGQILDALPCGDESTGWPRIAPGVAPRRRPEPSRAWTLGASRSGRVRARIEAPLGASLLVKAGGQSTRFPIAGLLETTEQTPPTAPVSVSVQRVPWDVLEIRLGDGDGTAAPGTKVPIMLGFNVLLAEPEQVVASFSAELRPARGSPTVWRFDAPPELMSANSLSPATRRFEVPVPREEGTYLIDVRATWDVASAAEGSRLSRLFRRRKTPGPITIERRLSLVVISPRDEPTAGEGRPGESAVVDSIDLSRARPGRPMISGRTPRARASDQAWQIPAEALVEPGLRDRVRGWIQRGGDADLGPADASGLAWAAVELRVRNPGRPHRLRLAIADPMPDESLGVALVAPGRAGVSQGPRVLLDTRATSGSADAAVGQAASAPTWHSWIVWPDVQQPLLMLVNPSSRGSVRIAAVELSELVGELPAAALLASPGSAQGRTVSLDVAHPQELDRFGGAVEGSRVRDVMAIGRNLSEYARHCGASIVVLPGELADRGQRQRLDGQAAEDAIGPDALRLCLHLLARRDVDALLDVSCEGALDNLPAPDSLEARQRGIARLDPRGRSHCSAYQILHPEVRSALETRLADAISPRVTYPNLLGLVVRLGPGPTVLGPPETGLDDTTYQAFIRDTFPPKEAANVPGLETKNDDRLAERAAFVTGAGKVAWLEWRARQLALVYDRLAASVRSAAPGATLGLVTPGLDSGPAGAAARLADEQGRPPDQAWQAVGVDLPRWPKTEIPHLVYRRIELADEGLASDLAVSPELDHAVATRLSRGFWVDGEAAVSRDFSAPVLISRPGVGDGALGHALAVIDPTAVVLAASSVAGREAAVARFARIFRALPAPPPAPPSPSLPSGVAVRALPDHGHTYISLANDTPYEVLQAMTLKGGPPSTIDDLGRGLRLEPADSKDGNPELVMRLPPFGIAAIRVGAPRVAVEPSGSYLPALPELEARAQSISQRLELGSGLNGPPLPGFEPVANSSRLPANVKPAAALAEIPPLPRELAPAARGESLEPLPPTLGWTLSGAAPNAILLDSAGPHSGRAALRLEARNLPVSVASAEFLAPGGRTLQLRTWLRSDRDEGRVRLWIEGRSKDEPLLRHADLVVGRQWTERAVRLPDLPPGGLETLRVRYEWLGPAPAIVWIDDFEVVGEGPSDTGRRAHRALLEALQAFRAKRYADFARVLGSRSVRRVTPELGHSAPADLVRTGQSTDLPAGTRLR